MSNGPVFNMCWMFNLRQWFYLLLALSQAIGVTAMILIIYYSAHYGGGFSWQVTHMIETDLMTYVTRKNEIFLTNSLFT
jgi:hypothetical protein